MGVSSGLNISYSIKFYLVLVNKNCPNDPAFYSMRIKEWQNSQNVEKKDLIAQQIYIDIKLVLFIFFNLG